MKSKFNCLSIIEMNIRQLYPKLEEMKVMMENETFHFVILEIQLFDHRNEYPATLSIEIRGNESNGK